MTHSVNAAFYAAEVEPVTASKVPRRILLCEAATRRVDDHPSRDHKKERDSPIEKHVVRRHTSSLAATGSACRVHLLAGHTLLRGDWGHFGGYLATGGNAPVVVEKTLRTCGCEYLRGAPSCCRSISPSSNAVLAACCPLAFALLYLWVWAGVRIVSGRSRTPLALCCI